VNRKWTRKKNTQISNVWKQFFSFLGFIFSGYFQKPIKKFDLIFAFRQLASFLFWGYCLFIYGLVAING